MANHDRAMSRQTTPIAQQLRERGLRVTSARFAVLEWLVEHPHATVEQVHDGVGQRIGSISKQAVYDVLAACIDADLVQQIKPAGHPARFERRTGDNHHHLVCRSCGRIEDVDCVVGAKPCLTPGHDHGFEVDEAEVMFWGLCQPCKTQRVQLEGDAV
jgi:Fur family ferric uptake transcriptional regulator